MDKFRIKFQNFEASNFEFRMVEPVLEAHLLHKTKFAPWKKKLFNLETHKFSTSRGGGFHVLLYKSCYEEVHSTRSS